MHSIDAVLCGNLCLSWPFINFVVVCKRAIIACEGRYDPHRNSVQTLSLS